MKPVVSETPFFAFPPSEVESSIPRRFESQVLSWPDRPAVRANGAGVTYRELNERANRVAHGLLQSDGETPEAVALLLPQGVDLVAAILAVLKAGKFYLGLDSSFPLALLTSTVTDAGARTVLTTSSQADLARTIVPEGGSVHILDGPEAIGEDKENPRVDVSPDHLAYVVCSGTREGGRASPRFGYGGRRFSSS